MLHIDEQMMIHKHTNIHRHAHMEKLYCYWLYLKLYEKLFVCTYHIFVTIIVTIIAVMMKTEKKLVISRQKGKSGTSSICIYRFSNIGTYKE